MRHFALLLHKYILTWQSQTPEPNRLTFSTPSHFINFNTISNLVKCKILMGPKFASLIKQN